MATHSCVLAWRIRGDTGAWQIIVHGVAESDTIELLTTSTVQAKPDEGPLPSTGRAPGASSF